MSRSLHAVPEGVFWGALFLKCGRHTDSFRKKRAFFFKDTFLQGDDTYLFRKTRNAADAGPLSGTWAGIRERKEAFSALLL
ncbi:hypothetical protein [uncultured Mailhella sp.]|uniref:hypothetical protein n=1 Tax=uncultured Mailhella sp. TaxID=1981031 RepID=UPI0025FCC049|nr:hypothetical protein [uncultured Mailhella sp.]